MDIPDAINYALNSDALNSITGGFLPENAHALDNILKFVLY